MRVLEERCDVITNMEVMFLLVQQQQQLPSVDSLLRSASKPSPSSPPQSTPVGTSKASLQTGSERDEGQAGDSKSAAERFRMDHVKDLLYQHMFNQMVQDYIRKTCPYLHLLRAPAELPSSADPSRSHPAARNPARRSVCGPFASRRSSGVGITRQGGAAHFISKRCRECLDALVHRFGLTDLELLTILNLGAHKLVEIYVFLDDCSNRFTEDDAAAMLKLIDLALVQQQALPPLPEPTAVAAMDVDPRNLPRHGADAAQIEMDALRQQQQELQEEARQLELQQQQVQVASEQVEDWPPPPSPREKGTTQDSGQADNTQEPSSLFDIFAPPEEAKQPAADGPSPPQNTPTAAKARGRGGRTPSAKRRAPSRRKRVLDD
ncbi:hypothetical protein ACSSS7_002331 [Eimeria intestinalis]